MTTTIKNGTFVLPERLRQAWGNAQVYVTGEKDTIMIKRLRPPEFSQMLNALNEVGKNLPSHILDEALASARERK